MHGMSATLSVDDFPTYFGSRFLALAKKSDSLTKMTRSIKKSNASFSSLWGQKIDKSHLITKMHR
jgi:hypothetical protein